MATSHRSTTRASAGEIAANVAAWRSRRRVAARRTTALVAAVRQGIALPRNTREALRLLPVRHGRHY